MDKSALVTIYPHKQNTDLKKAADIINTYDAPFMEDLPIEMGLNFDSLIHGAMEVFGVCKRWRRNPYMNANDEQMERIRAFFVEKGLLVL